MRCLLLTFCFAALTGCASTTLTLEFIAIEPVNLASADAEGKSRVVDVRIFQLKDDAKFSSATVESIWSDAEAALGDSLLATRQGESIFPEAPEGPRNGKEIVLDPLDGQTRFIGVLALFSETDDGPRKVVVPVAEAGSVLFELTGYHIKVKNQ
jgi:type VI secretion system VasD/TssJ family lipoprotein